MKTIFGVATPVGKSGVAVVRLSGNYALQAVTKLGAKNLKPREVFLRKISYNGNTIDKGVAVYFPAPNSFTGEDVVELQVHGSRAVIKTLLDVLASMPELRMAEPGEFSRRAFENGKMDLTEVEGLADLIEAETTAQHKQAMRQMEGELGRIYESWREKIIKNLANIEAYIDFPDEDLPQSLKDEITRGITNLKNEIDAHLNDNRRGEKIREGIEVAIIGAPNVGKSSLLNWLAGRDAAIVSDIAGTTRDVIEVNMAIGGYAVTIADTAGLRETADAIESEGIRRALKKAENADIKIIMVEGDDAEVLKHADDDAIVIINKSDEGRRSKVEGLSVSVKTGEGLDELLAVLNKKISEKFAESEQPVITRARHREALEKARASLNEISFDKPIELIAEDLRYSAHAIGRITGKIEVDDILDVIFSSFCIGK